MNTTPLRIRYCLSLYGALASNGKTAQVAHQILLKQLGIFKNLRAAIRK